MATQSDESVSAELHTPGGWWARLVGFDTKILLVIFVMVLLFSALWWQSVEVGREVRERDAAARVDFLAAHKVTQELLKVVVTNQSAIITILHQQQWATSRALAVQTYVLSLTEAQRRELKLEMPDELKLRRGR